jgi:predicted short-subunit dehydrogenase-like oxidoreductase (DUF2520 family)
LDRITIIGKGKVGRSLAAAIMFHGKDRLAGNLAARTQLRLKIQPDVLIIATRDDAIAQTAEKALAACKTPPRIIAHLSGSQPNTILPKQKGVARITLHPMQSIATPDRDLFKGIMWMASSNDRVAIRWAQDFVRSLGSTGVIVLPAESLPLYHAMTVFSSNFVTMLLSSIEKIATTLGRDPKKMKLALEPLLQRSLENALRNPAKEVLTGPIKRRDMETIKKHQLALEKADPNLRKIYDAFLNYGLGM